MNTTATTREGAERADTLLGGEAIDRSATAPICSAVNCVGADRAA